MLSRQATARVDGILLLTQIRRLSIFGASHEQLGALSTRFTTEDAYDVTASQLDSSESRKSNFPQTDRVLHLSLELAFGTLSDSQ